MSHSPRHLPVHVVERLVTELLDPAAKAEASAHLAACPMCSQRVEEAATAHAMFIGENPAALRIAQLRERARASRRRTRSALFWLGTSGTVALAAALLLLVVRPEDVAHPARGHTHLVEMYVASSDGGASAAAVGFEQAGHAAIDLEGTPNAARDDGQIVRRVSDRAVFPVDDGGGLAWLQQDILTE